MDAKIIIGVISGAVVGAIGGIIATKKYYKQCADDEVNEMREYYNRKVKDLKGDNNSEESVVKEGENPKQEDFTEDDKKVYEEKVRDYNGITKKEKPKKMEEPFSITENEFVAPNALEKIEALYFVNDNILVRDDTDEVVDDHEYVLGDLSHYFEDSNIDEIFIRNETYGSDYHIVRDERNFSEVYWE